MKADSFPECVDTDGIVFTFHLLLSYHHIRGIQVFGYSDNLFSYPILGEREKLSMLSHFCIFAKKYYSKSFCHG